MPCGSRPLWQAHWSRPPRGIAPMTDFRVLTVDDEPQVSRVLRTILTSQGYRVRTETDGIAALAAMKEWQPHLLLVDLCMPRMDGIELCRKVRTASRVPIIMLSVKSSEQSKVEALDAGAD